VRELWGAGSMQRVESIEIIEQASGCGSRGMRPHGFVFNIDSVCHVGKDFSQMIREKSDGK